MYPLDVDGASAGTELIVKGQNYYGFTTSGINGLLRSVSSGNQIMRFFGSPSDNVLIGPVTSDGNVKFDVTASGSAGTARFYDQTATTGVTKVVIRAGAGQSTTYLTEWRGANDALLAQITSGGVFSTGSNHVGITATPVASIQLGSGMGVGWASTTTYGGARDLAISRNAAGVLEINSGTAGTYRDLLLRRSQHNGVTVTNLPAAAAGNAGSIQYVTDSNSTTIGNTVAGGGSNKVLVWSDGAAWKIFAS